MAGRRSRLTAWVAAGVLLVLALTLVRVAGRRRNAGPGVDVVVTTRGPFVVTVTASGTVDADDVREVKARIPGRVGEVLVSEGQSLTAGGLAARIDESELAAQVEQARAQVRSAEADLYQTSAGAAGDEEIRQAAARLDAARARLSDLKKGSTESQVAQAVSAKEQARVTLAEAEANRDRMLRLYGEGAVPRTNLDDAEARVATARAVYEAAKKQHEAVVQGPSQETIEATAAQVTEAEAALALARQRSRNLGETEKAARARLTQARASLALAESQVALTRVSAPCSGVVVGKPVPVGTYVSPGVPLFKMGQLDTVIVRSMVDEVDIARVRMGQSARVTSDALGKRELAGTVSFISNKAASDAGVARFEVEVRVDNREGLLRPGMTADAEITVVRKDNVVRVPVQAIVQREKEANGAGSGSSGGNGTGGVSRPPRRRIIVSFGHPRQEDEEESQSPPAETEPVVFTVVNGRAERRRVVTGLENVADVEIVSGVGPGETVIVGDYQTLKTLRAGDKVSLSRPAEGR